MTRRAGHWSRGASRTLPASTDTARPIKLRRRSVTKTHGFSDGRTTGTEEGNFTKEGIPLLVIFHTRPAAVPDHLADPPGLARWLGSGSASGSATGPPLDH